VVMTGSHNLGFKASNANDDNLVIIEGNAPLAAAYAINIIAIFQTYRWNNYVEMHRKDPNVWHGLVDNDQWQKGYLDPAGDDFAELEFWLGGKAAAVPAPAGVPAASPAAVATPATPAAAKRHVAHTVSTRPHTAPKKKT
jgi:hypothetical protein